MRGLSRRYSYVYPLLVSFGQRFTNVDPRFKCTDADLKSTSKHIHSSLYTPELAASRILSDFIAKGRQQVSPT
jgi:hypothetical protein